MFVAALRYRLLSSCAMQRGQIPAAEKFSSWTNNSPTGQISAPARALSAKPAAEKREYELEWGLLSQGSNTGTPRLKQVCTSTVIDFPAQSSQHGILGLLWRDCFYSRIKEYRHRFKMVSHVPP